MAPHRRKGCGRAARRRTAGQGGKAPPISSPHAMSGGKIATPRRHAPDGQPPFRSIPPPASKRQPPAAPAPPSPRLSPAAARTALTSATGPASRPPPPLATPFATVHSTTPQRGPFGARPAPAAAPSPSPDLTAPSAEGASPSLPNPLEAANWLLPPGGQRRQLPPSLLSALSRRAL